MAEERNIGIVKRKALPRDVLLQGGTFYLDRIDTDTDKSPEDATEVHLFQEIRDGVYDFGAFLPYMGILEHLRLEGTGTREIKKLKEDLANLPVADGNSIIVNESLVGKELSGYVIDTTGTVTRPDGTTFKPDYVGTNALRTFDLTWGASVTSPNTSAQYRKFTYNSATKMGIIHLDFTPKSNLRANTELCRLGSNMPKPITLIESGAYGSNGANGNIWVNTDGIIRTGALTSGNRYIVDLIGYFQ